MMTQIFKRTLHSLPRVGISCFATLVLVAAGPLARATDEATAKSGPTVDWRVEAGSRHAQSLRDSTADNGRFVTEKLIPFATRYYAELNALFPLSNAARETDQAFTIVFPGTHPQLPASQAGINGNELYLYDHFLDTPLSRRDTGLLYHELTHFMQAPYRDSSPSWMVEGMADFTRFHLHDRRTLHDFFLLTQKDLAGLKQRVAEQEKKVAQGDLSLTGLLHEFGKQVQDFAAKGYQNHLNPIHAAGLLTLIETEYLKKTGSDKNIAQHLHEQLQRAYTLGQDFHDFDFSVFLVGLVDTPLDSLWCEYVLRAAQYEPPLFEGPAVAQRLGLGESKIASATFRARLSQQEREQACARLFRHLCDEDKSELESVFRKDDQALAQAIADESTGRGRPSAYQCGSAVKSTLLHIYGLFR